MKAPRLKVAFYTAKGTSNEAARWAYWARRAGFSSVGSWLEMLANRETKRQEAEGGYRPPTAGDETPPVLG